jgi:hypothetical protein
MLEFIHLYFSAFTQLVFDVNCKLLEKVSNQLLLCPQMFLNFLLCALACFTIQIFGDLTYLPTLMAKEHTFNGLMSN